MNDVISTMRRLAQERPDTVVFSFTDDDGRVARSLTWRALMSKIDDLGSHLQRRRDLCPGDRVLLVYPPSLDFVTAFLASLAVGLIPVPVYPPDPFRPGQRLRGLRHVAKDCGATAALTNTMYSRALKLGAVKRVFKRRAEAWPKIPWITTDRVGRGHAMQRVAPQEIALLQYTSGSVGEPKGVVITHANLLHQLEFNRVAMDLNAASVAVLWVPQYHDFGLISGILSAAVGNGHLVLMSPLSFIKRPAVWFDVMSELRATHTAAPNFGYELAVRKTTAQQRQGWDLSSLRRIMSAAEPINPDTVRSFYEGFRVSHIDPSAHCGAYGLAEHTVGVTVNGHRFVHFDRRALEQHRVAQIAPCTASPADKRELASCGEIPTGFKLRVVDADTLQQVPPCHVGEIWVSSPSNAVGYWGREQQTKESFQATLSGDDTHYLRTGDLGFVFEEELFICGRHKDLLILAGRNIFPQDIEDTARDVDPRIRPGGLVAFSVPDEGRGEQLVLFVELRVIDAPKAELQDLARIIRRAVVAEHHLTVHILAMLPPGGVPKTTSGKVQRRAARAQWARGETKAVLVCTADPDATVEQTDGAHSVLDVPPDARAEVAGEVLLRCLSGILGERPQDIPPDAPVMALGLDSLMALSLAHQLEDSLGVCVEVEQILDGITVLDLGAELAQMLGREPAQDEGVDTGGGAAQHLRSLQTLYLLHSSEQAGPRRFPATTAQCAMWTDAQLHPGALISSFAFRIDGAVSAAQIERAAMQTVQAAPMLAARGIVDDAGQLWIDLPDPLPIDLKVIDGQGMDDERVREELTRHVLRPFDLGASPLTRFRVLQIDERTTIVHVVLHHLIYDATTIFAVLWGWLHRVGGVEPAPDVQPTPFADFSSWERNALSHPRSERQRTFWHDNLRDAPLYRPLNGAYSESGATTVVPLSFAREHTLALKEYARAQGATLYTVMLAALAMAMRQTRSMDDVVIGSTVSLRDSTSLASVMGPVFNYLALRMDPGAHGATLDDMVRHTKDVVSAAMRHKRYPFHLLMAEIAPDVPRRPRLGLGVNFNLYDLDRLHGGGRAAAFRKGEVLQVGGLQMRYHPSATLPGVRTYELVIGVLDLGDELAGGLRYHRDTVGRDEMVALAQAWRDTLIAGCV